MFSRLLIRRLGLAAAGAMWIGSMVVSPASAVVPPGDGSSVSRCQSIDAGYSPASGWDDDSAGWAWDGRLSYDLCVVRTVSGAHYAIARLSSPSPTVLSGQYDRYTGVTWFYLQKCGTKGTISTMTQKDWSVAMYETGTLSGNWYRFRWTQTPSTTNSGATYRVKVVTYSANVVPRNSFAFVFALSPDGMFGTRTYTSNCMTP